MELRTLDTTADSITELIEPGDITFLSELPDELVKPLSARHRRQLHRLRRAYTALETLDGSTHALEGDTFYLLLWVDSTLSQLHPLGSGSLTVGRSADCDWSLPEISGLSRTHFRIERRDDLQWWLEDLNSKNGLILDDSSHTKVKLHQLGNGDHFAAGKTAQFTFLHHHLISY